MPTNFVMPPQQHNNLVAAAYRKRGFTPEESDAGARFCEMASRHGIKTHNAIKALHLDDHFGSKAGGCVPGATIEKLPSKYKAGRVYVTLDGHYTDDYKPYVFVSEDFGANWRSKKANSITAGCGS